MITLFVLKCLPVCHMGSWKLIDWGQVKLFENKYQGLMITQFVLKCLSVCRVGRWKWIDCGHIRYFENKLLVILWVNLMIKDMSCSSSMGKSWGKGSWGTIEVDVETLLESIVSYIFMYVQSDTHTHIQVHGSIRVLGYTKYTILQHKYYKYFTITVRYIICTHKQFIYTVKAVCI